MPDSFTLSYLLLIFGSALGVYQIAATRGKFKGLCFFKKPILNYICGFLILMLTLSWFFSMADLKMRHAEMEGPQQFGFFLLGSFCALLVNFFLSSLINFRGVNHSKGMIIGQGIEDLKERTVFQAIAYRLRNRRQK